MIRHMTLPLSLLAVFLITGCSNKTPDVRIVKETKVVYMTPPDYMLDMNFTLPTPPKSHTIIYSSPYQRELILTKYIIDLMKSNSECIIRYNAIKRWYKENKKDSNNE